MSWFELWWIFPAAIAFSTIAIGSGVSGALFFSPFFMLVVGLSPVQAVGAEPGAPRRGSGQASISASDDAGRISNGGEGSSPIVEARSSGSRAPPRCVVPPWMELL